MPKMKYWSGSAWVELDAKDGDTVDGLHFRVNSGKLQYSTNGTTWNNTGTDTSDANAIASQILSGRTAYVNGAKVTGTMPNRTFAATSNAYVNADGTKVDGTGVLCVRPKEGYYKSEVNAGGFGIIRINSTNILPQNIKKGISILGVAGTVEPLSSGTVIQADNLVKSKFNNIGGLSHMLTTSLGSQDFYYDTFVYGSYGSSTWSRYALRLDPYTGKEISRKIYGSNYHNVSAAHAHRANRQAYYGTQQYIIKADPDEPSADVAATWAINQPSFYIKGITSLPNEPNHIYVMSSTNMWVRKYNDSGDGTYAWSRTISSHFDILRLLLADGEFVYVVCDGNSSAPEGIGAYVIKIRASNGTIVSTKKHSNWGSATQAVIQNGRMYITGLFKLFIINLSDLSLVAEVYPPPSSYDHYKGVAAHGDTLFLSYAGGYQFHLADLDGVPYGNAMPSYSSSDSYEYMFSNGNFLLGCEYESGGGAFVYLLYPKEYKVI